MRGRWRWHKTAALALALMSAPTGAQLLKLDGDAPPPSAGTGADILAMADALDASIAQIRSRGQGPAIEAAAGLRRLARDLAREGERQGAAGSTRILVARTLAGHLAALDALLELPGLDPAVIEMLGASLGEGSALDLRGAKAGATELDRMLRDALAPLMGITGTPPGPWGWVDDPPRQPGAMEAPLGPDLARWEAIRGITPEAIASLRTLDQTLAEADRWAAYQRSSGALRADVRAAADSLLAADKPWLAPEARTQLATDFNDAAVALGTGPSMDNARAELQRITLIGRIVAGTDRLGSDAPGKKVRTAVSDLVRTRAADRQAERRAIETFDRVLASILAREGLGESRSLVRHLRPAWKTLDRDCQTAERAVVDVLPRLLQYESAMTDPAVLTAVAGHRRALEDLESLYKTSAALQVPRRTLPTQPAPLDPRRPRTPELPLPASPGRDGEPAAGWKPIADRLLKVSQDLAKPETHDVALEQLRSLAGRLPRFMALPGEEDLRITPGGGPPAGWSAVTGNRAMELPASIAAAREAWLESFVQTGSASDSARMELLENLMMQLSACAAAQALVERAGAVSSGRGPGSLPAWPGWELSPRACAALVTPACEPLARATALVLEGADAKAAEALAATHKEFPVALLLGRLERRAAAIGLGGGPAPAAALADLGSGAPLSPDAWMVAARDDLAHICRYAEEFASPIAPRNPSDPAAKPEDLRRVFLDFASSRARRVLAGLDRPAP
jgi:hypothetical protein